MTCIVGLVHDGIVYMGADSCATSYGLSYTTRSPKIFRIGEIIFGGCGYIRTLQIIQYNMDIPDHDIKKTDDMTYIVSSVVESIRGTLVTYGAAERINETDLFYGSLLVGYRGNLYDIDAGYGVHIEAHGYSSCGSGTELALGSLYTTQSFDIAPRDRVIMALEAAGRFSNSVGPPYLIETLEP